jgi:hypothetical protein
MLTNFTWWHFFGLFLLGALIYYPIIVYLFFREQLSRIWRRSFVQYSDDPFYNSGTEEASSVPEVESALPLTDAALTGMVTDLMEDIRNGVKVAKDSQASKDQLFALLKKTLAKYPQLKKAGQQVQINEFILQEAVRHNYTIHMAQVYALWANATEVNG